MSSTKFKQGVRRPNPRAHNKTELSIIDTALSSAKVDVVEEFRERPIFRDATGAADPTGGDGDVNVIKTEQYSLEYRLIGASTAIVPTWDAANGLNLALDAAAEGAEYTFGISSRSKRAYTVGSDKRFFVEATLAADTVADLAELALGFRKAEAYQALLDNYDELACLNIQAGDINIETILNGAATSTTDTTLDAVDTELVTLRVEVLSNGQCQFFVNGQLSTVAQFKFDSGEIVVPFLQYLSVGAGDPVYCSSIKVGSL